MSASTKAIVDAPAEGGGVAYYREQLRRLDAALEREDGPYSGLHDMAGDLNRGARRCLDAFFAGPSSHTWWGICHLRLLGIETVGHLAWRYGLTDDVAVSKAPEPSDLQRVFEQAVAERRSALELLARPSPTTRSAPPARAHEPEVGEPTDSAAGF